MDKTKIAVEVFNTNANLYQERFMDVSLYHEALNYFVDALPGNRILELACGPGNITKFLLDRKPGLQLLATDLSENMLNLAKANNPGAAMQFMDCREIWKLTEKYDGVVCGFGFPYLSKEEAIQFIKDATLVLQPGGVLYISTMEDDYGKSDWKLPGSGQGPAVFMHYHEAGYLIDALDENGFKLLLTDRQNYGEGETATVDLQLVAKWQA
jgi:ubiquinone/menaquinone biosynthesis C-methylase UbiE